MISAEPVLVPRPGFYGFYEEMLDWQLTGGDNSVNIPWLSALSAMFGNAWTTALAKSPHQPWVIGYSADEDWAGGGSSGPPAIGGTGGQDSGGFQG